MKLLFIGAMPPPVTGQALACKVLYDSLVNSNEVVVINLSRKGLNSGTATLGRLGQVIHILINVIKNRDADLIYLTVSESPLGVLKDIFIYFLCIGRLKKVLIHLHGGAGMRICLAESWILRWLHKLILPRIGGVVILGVRHKDIYESLIPSTKIHIVPNFAEDYIFQPPDLIDRKFSGIETIKILYLSNLLPGKGYIELVNAIKLLPSELRSHFQFDFAGGFESGSDHENFMRSIRGIDEVRYHGIANRDLKLSLFRDAHVFCLPTYYPYEGQPISILEAYASGCVVITTDHSGILDIFTPCRNGFLVQAKNVESLVGAILNTYVSKNGLIQIAEHNRSQAAELYRSEIFTDRMNANLNKVLNEANQ